MEAAEAGKNEQRLFPVFGQNTGRRDSRKVSRWFSSTRAPSGKKEKAPNQRLEAFSYLYVCVDRVSLKASSASLLRLG